MNIEDMTDQEKSVLLAKARGWKLLKLGQPLVDWYAQGGIDISALVEQSITEDEKFWFDKTGAIHREGVPNYYTDHMEVAWGMLNWATDTERRNNEEMIFWWIDTYTCNYSPAVAQRKWLDKILSLAIEAGIVEPLQSP